MLSSLATALLFGLAAAPTADLELLLDPAVVVPAARGTVPQAPRVSPSGDEFVYEVVKGGRVTLWRAQADGSQPACITCGDARQYENGYWHPSGEYLVFNQVPSARTKDGAIVVARYAKGKLGPRVEVARGARPQFSHPLGHVIFFESTRDGSNVLAYQILGPDPLAPTEKGLTELRGPISVINSVAEVSHPSIGADGSSIVFAARTTGLKLEGRVQLDDADRQNLFLLWRQLLTVDAKELEQRVFEATDTSLRTWRSEGDSGDSWRALSDYHEGGGPARTPAEMLLAKALVLGLIDRLAPEREGEVRAMLFPTLWTTDVFGAPIKPLVADPESAPAPQKWATVARDGSFAVFEAGLYTDRHIYLVAKRDGAWLPRAVRITTAGTYNSSPELDPTGQWIYFESNRGKQKAIWRARLDWNAIKAKLGS